MRPLNFCLEVFSGTTRVMTSSAVEARLRSAHPGASMDNVSLGLKFKYCEEVQYFENDRQLGLRNQDSHKYSGCRA